MVARLIPLALFFALASPLVRAELPDPTAPPASPTAEGAPPPPALTAIRRSGRQPVAILGGQAVRVGGRYQDARVVRIGETEVVLRRSGEILVLKLHPEAETRLHKK